MNFNIHHFFKHMLFLAFSILLLTLTNQANSKDFKFKKIDSYSGLTQNSINVIKEDKYGLIWVGTNNGLNRLEGSKINNFGNCNKPVLSTSKITDIEMLSNGLLISVYGVGVFKYVYKSNTFEKLDIDFGLNQSLINNIEIDSNNSTIWISSAGGGVYTYNLKTKRKREFFEGNDSKIKTNELVSILIVDSTIYVGANNGNLASINTNTFELIDITNISGNRLESITPYENKLIITSSSDKLIEYDLRTKVSKILDIDYELFSDYKAYGDIYITKDSLFYIATDKGVVIAKLKNGIFNLLHKIDYKNSNLSYGIFKTFLEDSRGNIWLGSNGNGLYLRGVKLEKFNKINFEKRTDIHFSSVRNINSINDSIWVNGYGGVLIFDPNFKIVGKKTHLTSKNSNDYIPSENIYCSVFDKENNDIIWLGTEGFGLIKYNFKQGKYYLIEEFKSKSKKIPLPNVFDIDYLENTLILSTSNGLISFNPDTELFSEVSVINDYLQKQDLKVTSTFIFGNKSYITFLGASPIVYDFETGEIIKLSNLIDSKISHKVLNSNVLLPYKDSTLLVATNEYGLIKYSFLNDKTINIDIESGLLNNTINCVLIDKNSNIWLSTNSGIAVVDSQNTIKNFSNYEFGLNSEYNRSASHIFNDSTFIFGATDGITYFNPLTTSNDTIHYDFIILNATVTNQNEQKTYNFIKNDTISTDSKNNGIRIRIIDLDDLSKHNSIYEYKIGNEWKLLIDNTIPFNDLEDGINKVEIRNINDGNNRCTSSIFIKLNNKVDMLYYLYIGLILISFVILFYIYRRRKVIEKGGYTYPIELEIPWILLDKNLKVLKSNDLFGDYTEFDNTNYLSEILTPNSLSIINQNIKLSRFNQPVSLESNLRSKRKKLETILIKIINDEAYCLLFIENFTSIEKEKLNDSMDKLFSVFIDTILEPLVITNWDGNIMYANREAMKFLEITDVNIPEINIIELFSLTSDNKLYQSFLSAKEGVPFKSEKFELEINNRTYTIEGSGNSLNYLERDVFLFIFKNITPQINLINELTESRINAERLSELKSLYISNLSHELKTPINAISGFTDIIISKSNEKSLMAYLDTIKSNTELLIQLIDDLLLYSKAESGKLILKPVPTNLNSLILDIKNLFQLDFEKKNIEFRTQLISSGIDQLLNIDQLKLKQVIINLISNSIKNTSDGVISMNFELNKQDDNYIKLMIRISDTGIGIPEHKLEEIFTAFAQIDSIEQTGTGLGLAITKRIIDSMGGEISVQSVIDEGTIFSVNINNINLVINKNEKKEVITSNDIIESILQEDKNVHFYDVESLIVAKTKLNGKLKSMQEDIQTNFLLKDINIFAKELESLGNLTNIGFINNYAEMLKESCKTIDVEKINTILENFHKLELTINKLIEKNYG
ncbi:MAG: ATP-binding protein [Chlorobiota bacterium]